METQYAENDEVAALRLPYSDEHADAVIYLPKARTGLQSWLKKVTGKELLELRPQGSERDVNVKLPRFKVEAKFLLKVL